MFVYICSMSFLMQIKSSLQELKPMLASKYHVSSIGLFGSVVRNDFSPATSDIDIIIDFDSPIGIEFIDSGKFGGELKFLPEPLDESRG